MSDSPTKPVRVRFAPSPTGPMHIGGLRTAIFNWLFARHHNGQFILRIEDTDRKRYNAAAEQLIFDAFSWMGLDIDESPSHGGDYGPYRQSERVELYQKWARWLVDNGKAYYDYTTPEELEQANKERMSKGEAPGYDRRHRDIDDETRTKLKAEGRPEVVRFKMPLSGTTVVHDTLRGNVEFDNTQLNDLVLLKSDGFPTYHLANVVDDHFMEISHIMRANEWLASAPLHQQLYAAFGWDMPIITHLPVLLNPNGKGKMSKRSLVDQKGNVVPVLVHEYAEAGFLPEAMMNFLTNIGWSFGDDREVFSVEEAIARFDGSRINPVNSAYPVDKLRWFNGVYIREKTDASALQKHLRKPLEDAGLTVDETKLALITPAIQPRLETLNDVVELAGFIFRDDFTPAPAADHIQKKMDATGTITVLQLTKTFLGSADFANPDSMEAPMRELAEENGFKVGQFFGTLRVALSAQRVAPPLFDTMAALGREETERRIDLSIAVMEQYTPSED